MTPALAPADFDDLHEFITVQVAAGFAAITEIVEEARMAFTAPETDPVMLDNAVKAIAAQADRAHRAEQLSWPAVTDCDRLDAAFAALDETGILSRQHFTCCATCGAADIRSEMDQADKAGTMVRGFTFFHGQDTRCAVGGEALYLSFGATAPDDHEAAVAIGHEVVGTLRDHGLVPGWNGRYAHRIAVPVCWRRRRA